MHTPMHTVAPVPACCLFLNPPATIGELRHPFHWLRPVVKHKFFDSSGSGLFPSLPWPRVAEFSECHECSQGLTYQIILSALLWSYLHTPRLHGKHLHISNVGMKRSGLDMIGILGDKLQQV